MSATGETSKNRKKKVAEVDSPVSAIVDNLYMEQGTVLFLLVTGQPNIVVRF